MYVKWTRRIDLSGHAPAPDPVHVHNEELEGRKWEKNCRGWGAERNLWSGLVRAAVSE